ncbi:hypothetical protein NL676_010618 [Syzygium grande]|nr:hypothetical protein NL676_010618 [Syzygium grande]
MLAALGCSEGVLSGEGEATGITTHWSAFDENALLRIFGNGLLNFGIPLLCCVADRDLMRTDFPAPGVGVVGDGRVSARRVALRWHGIAARGIRYWAPSTGTLAGTPGIYARSWHVRHAITGAAPARCLAMVRSAYRVLRARREVPADVQPMAAWGWSGLARRFPEPVRGEGRPGGERDAGSLARALVAGRDGGKATRPGESPLRPTQRILAEAWAAGLLAVLAAEAAEGVVRAGVRR